MFRGVVFVLAWLSGLSAVQAAPCRDYVLTTWRLYLAKQRLVQVAHSANRIRLCDPLPRASGVENAVLEVYVRSTRKMLFRRHVLLNLQYYYDYIDDEDQLKGGVQSEKNPFLTTLVPLALLGMKGILARVVDTESGHVLAEGAL